LAAVVTSKPVAPELYSGKSVQLFIIIDQQNLSSDGHCISFRAYDKLRVAGAHCLFNKPVRLFTLRLGRERHLFEEVPQ
jgi:hypothetical protein